MPRHDRVFLGCGGCPFGRQGGREISGETPGGGDAPQLGLPRRRPQENLHTESDKAAHFSRGCDQFVQNSQFSSVNLAQEPAALAGCHALFLSWRGAPRKGGGCASHSSRHCWRGRRYRQLQGHRRPSEPGWSEGSEKGEGDGRARHFPWVRGPFEHPICYYRHRYIRGCSHRDHFR